MCFDFIWTQLFKKNSVDLLIILLKHKNNNTNYFRYLQLNNICNRNTIQIFQKNEKSLRMPLDTLLSLTTIQREI